MSSKRIHFIRHAQSEHNARFEAADDELAVRHDPCLRDAPLTVLGKGQARALQEEVAALREIELVVVSPLTRAVQTTLAAFADHPAPRIVHDLPREHLQSFCDIGRPPAALIRDFPTLAFDHLADPWWHVGENGGGPFAPEPEDVLAARVVGFADWLSARPEAEIAVVGHGGFLRHMTGHAFGNAERIVTRF
jgi:glucosyl-3-phosphoglycerate phosphatase